MYVHITHNTYAYTYTYVLHMFIGVVQYYYILQKCSYVICHMHICIYAYTRDVNMNMMQYKICISPFKKTYYIDELLMLLGLPCSESFA